MPCRQGEELSLAPTGRQFREGLSQPSPLLRHGNVDCDGQVDPSSTSQRSYIVCCMPSPVAKAQASSASEPWEMNEITLLPPASPFSCLGCTFLSPGLVFLLPRTCACCSSYPKWIHFQLPLALQVLLFILACSDTLLQRIHHPVFSNFFFTFGHCIKQPPLLSWRISHFTPNFLLCTCAQLHYFIASEQLGFGCLKNIPWRRYISFLPQHIYYVVDLRIHLAYYDLYEPWCSHGSFYISTYHA